MRLIDADALSEEVTNLFIMLTGEHKQATVVDECKRSFLQMIDDQKTAGEWIPAKTPPDRTMRVQALIKHHKFITDYNSDWVPEEEKVVHPERMEVCEAIYRNGTFTFRDMDDEEFVVEAYIAPEENVAVPVSEILMWRPIECAVDNWIPVEDRLPERIIEIDNGVFGSEPVIVTVVNEEGKIHRACDFLIGEKWACAFKNEKVIAWQPLPEPYRPEGGENEL